MRERWACPDLGRNKPEGYEQPIPGSSYELRECPRYYNRIASDGLPADHLIDGAIHPVSEISQRAAELECGAIPADTLSPKVLSLTHLYLAERAAKRDYEVQERERKTKAGIK